MGRAERRKGIDMDDKKLPKKQGHIHTIKSLRLDLEEAMAGRTWLLLPEGFRAAECGLTYPLPSRRLELQKLSGIYIPPNKQDCGCKYIKRAIKAWKSRQRQATSAVLDVQRRQKSIQQSQWNYNREIKKLKQEAREAVDGVKAEAAQAIASLKDLFALGRRGIDAQMRAHLAGEEWQGEKITARAFRECFRMVTQAVKGLGLPSEQRAKADAAIMEEVAASIKATQETLALAPGTEPETEH